MTSMQNWENAESPESRIANHPRRKRLGNLLIALGIVLALVPLLTVAYGLVGQWVLQREWGEEFEARAAEQQSVADKGVKSDIEDDVLSEGALIPVQRGRDKKFPATKIRIPKIGVDQVVSEGSGTEELKRGPGHYIGMAIPGERGNVGIAGHRVTWTKPFNRLDELDPGDSIILETFERRFEYRVVLSKVLDPKDTSMLRPTQDARVTLTTCNPKYSARTRLDVQAVLVRTVDKTPGVVRLISALSRRGSSDEPGRDGTAEDFAPKTELELARIKVKEAPRDSELRIRLGVLLMGDGDTADALAEFRKADSLSPDSPLAPYYLGLLSRSGGQNVEAARLLTEALERDARFEPALYELGAIYIELGDAAKAIQVLERATALSPLDAETLRALARARELSGDRAGAIEAYEQVLRFLPEDKATEAAIERLRQPKRGVS